MTPKSKQVYQRGYQKDQDQLLIVLPIAKYAQLSLFSLMCSTNMEINIMRISLKYCINVIAFLHFRWKNSRCPGLSSQRIFTQISLIFNYITSQRIMEVLHYSSNNLMAPELCQISTKLKRDCSTPITGLFGSNYVFRLHAYSLFGSYYICHAQWSHRYF